MPEQKRAFNEGDIIIMEEMTKVENANDRVLVAGCACIIFSRLTPEEIRQFKT